MKKKRAMLVGDIRSGKSTLVNALNDLGHQAEKTQAMRYVANLVDTPGEYCQIPQMRQALYATALDVDVIIIVQDATEEKSFFSPGFAKGFPKRSIGVVTKIDHPDADLKRAKRYLERLCISDPDFVYTSAYTGEGLSTLEKKLDDV